MIKHSQILIKNMIIENVHEYCYLEVTVIHQAVRGKKGAYHIIVEDQEKTQVILNVVDLEKKYDLRSYEVG